GRTWLGLLSKFAAPVPAGPAVPPASTPLTRDPDALSQSSFAESAPWPCPYPNAGLFFPCLVQERPEQLPSGFPSPGVGAMGKDPEPATGSTLLDRVSHPDDPRAWDRFVDRYSPKIWGWCRHWRLHEADAEDVTQEVLTKLLRNLRRRWTYDPKK